MARRVELELELAGIVEFVKLKVDTRKSWSSDLCKIRRIEGKNAERFLQEENPLFLLYGDLELNNRKATLRYLLSTSLLELKKLRRRMSEIKKELKDL